MLSKKQPICTVDQMIAYLSQDDLPSVHRAARSGFRFRQTDQKQWTALHYCARFNSIRVATFLLQRGLDMEVRDRQGIRPIHLAAWYNATDILQLLLIRGADFFAKDKQGWTPLFLAAWNNHEHIVQLLITAGVAYNKQHRSGYTAVHFAAWNNSCTALRHLLQAKAKIQKYQGIHPATLAAAKNHIAIMQLLGYSAVPEYFSRNDADKNLHRAQESLPQADNVYTETAADVALTAVFSVPVNTQAHSPASASHIPKQKDSTPQDPAHKELNSDNMRRFMQTIAKQKSCDIPDDILEKQNAPVQNPAMPDSPPEQQAPVLYSTAPETSASKTTISKTTISKTTTDETQLPTIETSATELSASKSAVKTITNQDKAMVSGSHYPEKNSHANSSKKPVNKYTAYMNKVVADQLRQASDGLPDTPDDTYCAIALSGNKVSHKTEAIIANILFCLEIPFYYQRKICGTVAPGIHYPSFSFFDQNDKLVLWEHLASSVEQEIDSKQVISQCRQWYENNGFVYNQTFFLTTDASDDAFDSRQAWNIAQKIKALI